MPLDFQMYRMVHDQQNNVMPNAMPYLQDGQHAVLVVGNPDAISIDDALQPSMHALN